MKLPIFKRIFSRKTLIRLAFTLVVLITLVMIFYRIEMWRGERAWETYRKSAEARGVKLWLKDLVTPPIPDAENYAAIPFFMGQFGTDDQRTAAEAMLPQWRIEKPKRPLLGDITKGTAMDVTAWRDYLVAAKVIPSPTDNPANDIIAAFEKLPALQQIRAASSRPACRFPVEMEKGFATPLPHLGAMQRASAYFAVSAGAKMAAKDGAGALADGMQILRMSEALRTEPYLIGLLVQFSLLDKVNVILRDGLSAGVWKEDDLTAVERRLSAQNLIAGYRLGMACERAGMTTEFDRMSRAPMSELYKMFGLLDAVGGGNSRTNNATLALYPRGWLHFCKVKSNELHDALLAGYAPVNGVEPEFIAPRPENGPLQQLQHLSAFDRYRYALVVMAMPVFSHLDDSLLFTQARLTQVRIACALERIRLSSGAFPESLDVVAPHFGGTIPRDICDGKPMRYRRTADGYELWSVALNRVDDDGANLPKEDERKKQPDWLWKLTLKPQP